MLQGAQLNGMDSLGQKYLNNSLSITFTKVYFPLNLLPKISRTNDKYILA